MVAEDQSVHLAKTGLEENREVLDPSVKLVFEEPLELLVSTETQVLGERLVSAVHPVRTESSEFLDQRDSVEIKEPQEPAVIPECKDQKAKTGSPDQLV